MFNLFKKKDPQAVYAFCDGTLIPLTEVKDPMFSQHMMGEGCAIYPSNNEITSPFDGTVIMIFPTKHAIGLKREDGLEILIHIGMDTVNENGKGFVSYVEEGDRIRCGEALLKFDRKGLLDKGYDLTIPCVITSPDSFSVASIADKQTVTHSESKLIIAGKN